VIYWRHRGFASHLSPAGSRADGGVAGVARPPAPAVGCLWQPHCASQKGDSMPGSPCQHVIPAVLLMSALVLARLPSSFDHVAVLMQTFLAVASL
jgi:hypothetical protein